MSRTSRSKHWPTIRRTLIIIGTALALGAVAAGEAVPVVAKMIWS
jgi:hypothetical protein